MFSPDIVNSDAFLEMPPSTQALYFQLGMKADDDGFVNPKMVMRMMGSTEDELKVLKGKNFVIPFDNGVVVIKHWRINNFIRKDRYRETTYVEQRKLLFVKQNCSFTLNENHGIPIEKSVWKSDEDMRLTSGQPNDIPLVNPGKDRIGKDRIGKVSKNTYGEFENVNLTEEEYSKLVQKLTEKNTRILIEELSTYMASRKTKYTSHYAVILQWARKKYQDHQSKTKGIASINKTS